MSEHARGSLLAQTAPSVTTPVLAFTATLPTEITLILGACPSAAPATLNIDIFHDDAGGSTYNSTTRIFANTRTKNTGSNVIFHAAHPGSGLHVKPGGQIAVQTDNADDITFSIYGVTANVAPGRR